MARLGSILFCRTLYIQLVSPKSVLELQADLNRDAAQAESCTQDLRGRVQEEHAVFAKAALLLFLTCHVVVWAHPSKSLDATLVQQMRNLQVLSFILHHKVGAVSVQFYINTSCTL